MKTRFLVHSNTWAHLVPMSMRRLLKFPLRETPVLHLIWASRLVMVGGFYHKRSQVNMWEWLDIHTTFQNSGNVQRVYLTLKKSIMPCRAPRNLLKQSFSCLNKQESGNVASFMCFIVVTYFLEMCGIKLRMFCFWCNPWKKWFALFYIFMKGSVLWLKYQATVL
jgi:hypothetical protein